MKAKICKKEGCNNPIWSHGYCKMHIRYSVHLRQTINLKSISSTRERGIVQQKKADDAFYKKIWEKKRHYCSYCFIFIGDEPKKYMFDHILEKSKYKSLRYEEDNIALTCFDCHNTKTSKKYTYIMSTIIFATIKHFIYKNKLIQIDNNIDLYRLKDCIKEKDINN